MEPEDNKAITLGRDIISLAGLEATAGDCRKFRKIGLAFNSKEAKLVLVKRRI